MSVRVLSVIGAGAVLIAAAVLLQPPTQDGTSPAGEARGAPVGRALSRHNVDPSRIVEEAAVGTVREAAVSEGDREPAIQGTARSLRFETSAGLPPPPGTRARWKGEGGDGAALDVEGVALLSAPAPEGARIELLGPRVMVTAGTGVDLMRDPTETLVGLAFAGWGVVHRMSQEPWEVCGTVVNQRGEALGGLEVELEGGRLSGFGKRQLRLPKDGRFGVRCWVAEGRLTDLSVLHVLHRAGRPPLRTELHADVALDFFRRPVRGVADLRLIEVRPVAPQASNQDGPGKAAGAIWASVQMDGSVDRGQLYLHAIGPETPPGGAPFEWGKKGAWAQGLAPGTYDVTLSVGHRVVFRAGGVEVREGEVTRDPRLTPVTPGSALTTIRITPEYAPGAQATSNARLDVRGPGGWVKVVALEHTPRRTFLVAVHDAVDLRLSADGCRTAYAPGVTADRTIELGAGVPVEVDVFELPPFHGDPQWQLVLTHRRSGLSLEADLDGSRASFGVGESGTYDAVLRFARHGPWMFMRQGAGIGRFDVEGTAMQAKLTVPPDFMQNSR